MEARAYPIAVSWSAEDAAWVADPPRLGISCLARWSAVRPVVFIGGLRWWRSMSRPRSAMGLKDGAGRPPVLAPRAFDSDGSRLTQVANDML